MMKPDIFLITIDALRTDYLLKSTHNIHPFLSELVRDSLNFNKAISPGGATNQSFRSLFTNLYPHESMISDETNFNIPPNEKLISEYFKEKGYSTFGFNSNANLTRIQGYNKGFDYFYDVLEGKNDVSEKKEEKNFTNETNKMIKRYYDKFDLKLNFDNWLGKRIIGHYVNLTSSRGYELSKDILEKIKAKLDSYDEDKPIFLWFHLMEVHSPYNLSEDLFSKINEEKIPLWERQWLRHKRHHHKYVSKSGMTAKDMEKIKTLYKCGIRECDFVVKEFYDYLKSNGFLDDGYLVITSDHGENLGDWDLLSHRDLYNSNIHVPLIIHDGKEKGEINEVFSNADLMDLLLDISEDENIKKKIKKYTGPAISEAGLKNFMKFAIQDDDYKIKIDTKNDYTEYFKLDKNQKEVKKISKNKRIEELEDILNNHISKIKDEEKDKISRSLKNIKI